MGIVTGKGLADLIRGKTQEVKVTFFIFIGLLLADVGNTTTEILPGWRKHGGSSRLASNISVPMVAPYGLVPGG